MDLYVCLCMCNPITGLLKVPPSPPGFEKQLIVFQNMWFGTSMFFKTHDRVIKLDTNSKNRPKASLHKGGGRWPPPTKGVGRSAAHPLCGNPLWRLAFGLFFEFVSNLITQSCVLKNVEFPKHLITQLGVLKNVEIPKHLITPCI